jgi:uncharacterized membrane protein
MGNRKKKKNSPATTSSHLRDRNPQQPVDPLSAGNLGLVKSVQIQKSGPIPDSSELKRYEEVLPGLADRIMAMAELEQKHQNSRDLKIVEVSETEIKAEGREALIGQVFGFLIGIFTIFTAGYCIVLGHEWAGGFLGSAGLGSIITAFIYGRKPQPSPELPQK